MNYPQCQLNLMSGYLVPKTSAMNFRIIEKPISFQELDMILQVKNPYRMDMEEELPGGIKINGENNTQFSINKIG